jgi:hypothetical protein
MDMGFLFALLIMTFYVALNVPLVWWDWHPERMPERLRLLPGVFAEWGTAGMLAGLPGVLMSWALFLYQEWPNVVFKVATILFFVPFLLMLPFWFSVALFGRPRFPIPPYIREQLARERAGEISEDEDGDVGPHGGTATGPNVLVLV